MNPSGIIYSFMGLVGNVNRKLDAPVGASGLSFSREKACLLPPSSICKASGASGGVLMSIVPAVQRLGPNAYFVKEQHQTISNRRAPGAFPVVVAS